MFQLNRILELKDICYFPDKYHFKPNSFNMQIRKPNLWKDSWLAQGLGLINASVGTYTQF